MPSSEFHTDPAPLYLKTKQMIINKIQSGEWYYNFKIPSEAELVKHLSISRMTINRAMRELMSEGYLIRIQGVGSFVAKQKGQSALFKVENIADEIQQRGRSHSSQVIIMETIDLNDAESSIKRLDFQQGTPIYHSLIVHYEDKIPVQIEERYVNAEIVPEYILQDFTKQTPNKYLNHVAPATEGEHIVEAVLADKQECSLLNINPKDPCLLIYRRTWSNAIIISNTKLIYPGSRYQLKGKFGL
ncbi:histidine utilization repressor [Commensalibacter nepenthis]|uniref:Histidine utilization repressor n=1 Tax=Commensalibacter nepenthis TaxID=3043872 RepID=A0ABT6QA83_9PROT|nr:histidine utilization repressor [Commensalibacter sp. TBRC 10068]MDI2113817.1 histidine utilization repressor [Commensalibacter sp. TBRC 10068]